MTEVASLESARAARQARGKDDVKPLRKGAAKSAPVKKAPARKSAGTVAKASPVKKATAAKAVKKAAPPLKFALQPDGPERLAAAKYEGKALKAWRRGNNQGPRPATLNLDAIAVTADANARKPSGTRGTSVQFFRDGTPFPVSQNKLSSVAWYCTKGIGGEDVKRISVGDLRKLLADGGVSDPSRVAGWSVALPNGVTVSAGTLSNG